MVESVVQSHAEIVVGSDEKKLIRVLHVDDELGLLKVAKQCLELQGAFHVDTANSVEEALNKLKEKEYDAVVSDYQMPGKDGLEFLEMLRKNGNTIPFIMLTGKGREETAIKALSLGADRYLNKTGDSETVYCELGDAIRQITEQRTLERASARAELFDKQARLQSVFDTSPSALLVIDLNGRIVDYNERAQEIFGYSSKSESVGRSALELIAEEDRQSAMENMERTLKQGLMRNIEYTIAAKDGSKHTLSVTASVLRDVSGNPTGFVSAIEDITERKKSEELLSESEERFRDLYESIQEPVAIYVGREGHLINYNSAFKKLTGYTDEELKDKTFLDLTHPEDRAMVLEKYRTDYAEEKLPLVYEVRGINRKGETEYLEVSVNAYRRKGRVIGTEAIYRVITERKKMEEKLRESDERLRNLYESVPDSLAVYVGREGRLTEYNKAFKKWSRYTDEELKDKAFLDFVHPDDRTLVMEKYRTNYSEDQFPLIYEIRTVNKKGESHPTEISVGPYRTKGRIIGINVMHRDITERKRMEEELRDSEERFRDLYESIQDPVGIFVGREGHLIEYNKAFKKLCGYTDEELKDKAFLDFVHPDDHALVLEKYQTSYSEEELPLVYEIRGMDKKGESIPLEISVSAYKRKGRIIGIEVIHRDLTERKKTEMALKESQRRFEGLFMGSPEAAAYLDQDFRVRDINPRFKELFGYSLADVQGKQINDVVVPDDRRKEGEAFDKEAKKGYVYHDTVRRKKDWSQVQVAVSAAPITVGGKVAGIVAMYHDISDLKNAEKRLDAMNEKLRVVGSLTRHDVRNKLTTVVGNAHLLKKRLTADSDAIESLRSIEIAVRESARIFDFAAAYEKLGVEQLAHMDVKKTVEEAVGLFPDLKGVKIVNDCGGLTLLADSLLRQLFYNLIDDSLKYGEKLTQIRIRYEKSENQLKLIYEDDGVGISQDAKPKLFSEGYTTGKGSGYGLYLIKRMMEAYGWTIQETGTPDNGVCFTILIPEKNQDCRENYQLH
jgi:PAS domain S-box-containing protein